MATNYAQKYSPLVDERFTQASLTQVAFNNDYDFEGVNTVNVYSVNTAPLNPYTMSGQQRYGIADELGTDTQAMTLAQDMAFTFTIDRRNYTDQMMVTESGRALRRQVDEVIIPAVDKYRIARLVAGAGNTSAPTTITSSNAYESFLNGITAILDNKAPLAGPFAFIGPNFFKYIRLDPGFIQRGDLAQTMLVTGQVGMIESVPLVFAPTAYFPTGVEFVITNRIAALSPVKIADYKTHDNPPGINGWLAEGRIYYDAFVLSNKAGAVYAHTSSEPEEPEEPEEP